MSSYYYPKGIRFRAVVAACEQDSEGESTGLSVERVVCVEVDVFPAATQRQRAREMVQAVIQALYPRLNDFDIYNLVDEIEDPAAVLGYVTGFGGNHQRYESNPVVCFRTPHNPADYREPDAETWDKYFAADEVARRQAGAVAV